MAFSFVPPRQTVPDVIRTIDEFSSHADAVIDHRDVPWAKLLAGTTPEAFIASDMQGLYDYLATKHLVTDIMLEPADGLDRTKEARELIAAGKSMADIDVQENYVAFAVAVARRFHPQYMGLGSEVNVLLDTLPASARAGLIRMCAEAAAQIKTVSPKTKVYVSVQTEYAWGKLIGDVPFRGVEGTFTSFPFTEVLGVSTYPYFAWPTPADVPSNYFNRMKGTRTIPIVIDEGGWTSGTAGTIQSTDARQAEWITKLCSLADKSNALSIGQLTYTDLDLTGIGGTDGTTLSLFSHLGVTDTQWHAKPALAAWDAQFKRRYTSR